MVFNSYEFIVIFLPLAFLAFATAQRLAGWPAAYAVLAVASLVFYGQFSLLLLGILSVSVVSNYVVGSVLIRATAAGRPSGGLLLAAIAGNLAALAYFKYMNFFIDIANQFSGAGFTHLDTILPIGISFYTFIQIGYLIEAHSGQAKPQPFIRYVTFATFFPCVTAGPLVLQREIFDQMENRKDSALDARRIAVGVAMFSIGLFKKVMIADSLAPYADTVFNGVAGGMSVDVLTAWTGALAYSLQLYFDFSGYTDMALGLGAIFGIMLPLNFNSPFKATSISDFWQRWHMTMTRFFTTYVYTPLAMRGMRRAMAAKYAPVQRYMTSAAWPIVFTMLVAGIWHGSGWVFVLYGLLHGVAIAVNNGWKQFQLPKISPMAGWVLTMSVVVSGLVIFRAADVPTSLSILSSMWGISLVLPAAGTAAVSIALMEIAPLILVLGALVLLAPNTQEILAREWISCNPKPDHLSRFAAWISWRPAFGWSAATAALFVVALTSIGSESSFLYYQF